MRLTANDIFRINDRAVARRKSLRDLPIAAPDGSITVSVTYNGKMITQTITAAQLNAAYGKALMRHGQKI